MLNHKELYNLYLKVVKQEEKALDVYYALRDAKSDGCLSGKELIEVIKYDQKILEAYSQYLQIQKEVINY